MTKYSFKRIVKTKVKEAALSFLMQKKKDHSKLNNLKYKKLQMQPYFKSKRLNTNQVKQLFKFRTRMSNVKGNFKSKYTKIGYICPLKCGQYEDDQHLLKCSKTEIYRSNSEAKLENIFSGDINAQGVIIDLLMKAEKTRDLLLENKNI